MKKIITTITTWVFINGATGLVLLPIIEHDVVSENFFLRTINEQASVCLN